MLRTTSALVLRLGLSLLAGCGGSNQAIVSGAGKLLFINDTEVPVTVPIIYGLGGAITIGEDTGSPVTPEYQPPFAFTGTIKRVRVDVSGEPFVDQAARFKAMMAR